VTNRIHIRAVIVGVSCEPHVVRTLESWHAAIARAGVRGEAIVVLRQGDSYREEARAAGAEVVEVDPDGFLTPGGNRNRGAEGAETEWICFLDGDIELEEGFLTRALAVVEREPRVAGFAGRLDERHWKGGGVVGGAADLYHVGAGGEIKILGAAWICRRDAFEEIGGFDAALPAEEDSEISIRLRRAGWRLWTESEVMGWHDCAPRPSLAELVRRWKSGLYAGQGLALRRAWGKPEFNELLVRQWPFLSALFYFAVALVLLGAALAGSPLALAAWTLLGLMGMAVMSLRKRSLRLGFMSLLTWTVQGVALVRAYFFGPWGEMTGRRAVAGRARD
jgi:hypothetical protein